MKKCCSLLLIVVLCFICLVPALGESSGSTFPYDFIGFKAYFDSMMLGNLEIQPSWVPQETTEGLYIRADIPGYGQVKVEVDENLSIFAITCSAETGFADGNMTDDRALQLFWIAVMSAKAATDISAINGETALTVLQELDNVIAMLLSDIENIPGGVTIATKPADDCMWDIMCSLWQEPAGESLHITFTMTPGIN